MKWSSLSYRLASAFHFRFLFKACRRFLYDYVTVGVSRDWSNPNKRPKFYKREAQLYSWHYTAKENGPFWLEAAFKSMEVMKKGDHVLDIGTGDGFFPFFFYRFWADKIDAIDIEEDAVIHAQENYPDPTIRYSICDIIKDPFPGKGYNTVLWHNAMDFITLEDQLVVMDKIIACSAPSVVMFGSVFLLSDRNYQANDAHKKSAFFSEDELKSHLSKKFQIVDIKLADHLHRKILYFACSQPK